MGAYFVWSASQAGQRADVATRQAVAAAGTAAGNATQIAAAATDAAATAIALTAAAEGDDDNDGLSNAAEASLGTDPNNPDTDGDGLSDGLEVHKYGTLPKNQDTDGDTLTDGHEVETLKTSPLEKDTDGDGLNDNIDPDPLSLPTATSTFTPVPPTSTPTPTPASTATATATATTRPSDTPTATATVAPSPTSTSLPQVQSWTHAIGLLDNRQIYYLRLTGPGLISVNAAFTGPQNNLAIIINGPGQGGYYARQDGASPLQASYNVTASDFSTGDTWRVTIASFGSQRADGTVTISYPSGAATGAFTNEFAVLPDYGNITSVLVLRNNGVINAQSSWTGTPSTLAFIINGPGQVGYYAREDGSSPLSVSYNVSGSDFAAGDYWRVSLAAFSDPSISNANIMLNYP